MSGNIGMISPEDLQYLAHITDESFLVNATPIVVKRVNVSTTPTDDLFDEALPGQEDFVNFTVNMVMVPRPDRRVLERLGARTDTKLLVAVSYLETQRVEWVPDPEDIIEYPDMDGKLSKYHITSVAHDGMFIDTNGLQHPLSYSITATDKKGDE
jgi:hypothetical protein